MKKIFGKRAFSNAIIVYCVAYMSVYLAACLAVLVKTGTNPGTCVTVAGGFFGGELLLICLAYRFGKVSAKKEDGEEGAEEENEGFRYVTVRGFETEANEDWSESV